MYNDKILLMLQTSQENAKNLKTLPKNTKAFNVRKYYFAKNLAQNSSHSSYCVRNGICAVMVLTVFSPGEFLHRIIMPNDVVAKVL